MSKLVKEKFAKDLQGKILSHTVYNTNGNIILFEKFNKDGSIKCNDILQYDDNNNLIKYEQNEYLENGDIKNTWIMYETDENGKLLKEITSNNEVYEYTRIKVNDYSEIEKIYINERCTTMYVYNYNENKTIKKIHAIYLDGNGEVSFQEWTEFNDKEDILYHKESSTDIEYFYEYDENGNNTSILEKRKDETLREDIFKYDSNSNMIYHTVATEYFDTYKLEEFFKFEEFYEYDEDNNIIIKTTFRCGDKDTVTVFEYIYY